MISDLKYALRKGSNPAQARAMAAYMRNQFPFLGIKAPQREQLVIAWLKAQTMPSSQVLLAWVDFLYQLPEREFQYAACDLLKSSIRKVDPMFWLPRLSDYMTTKSWWDTVDVWSPKIAANLLKRVPDQFVNYPDQWIQAENFWLQRAAIIVQLNYRDQMDLDRIFAYSRQHSGSSEFFVQKAIGWSLRSASRYFPREILAFLEREEQSLSPLSLREGSKLLKKKGLWG
ncbi:MAG: DNA alkylation repair protein [Bacteroidota bacterium]